MKAIWVRRILARSAVLWAIACLTGCAVLTVEVDVYKGILSNEKSTQVNYLISLATSSRDLLVKMFNNLEVNADPDESNKKERTTLSIRINPEDKIELFESTVTKTTITEKPVHIDTMHKRYHERRGELLAEARTSQYIYELLLTFQNPQNKSSFILSRLTAFTGLKTTPDSASKELFTLLDSAKKTGVSNEELVDSLRRHMSELGHKMLLISAYSNPEPTGIGPRLYKSLKKTWRNGGRPKNAEALLIIQALGNSILAITDELSHAESWESANHARALNDLNAIQSSLYGPGLAYLNVWQLESEQQLKPSAATQAAQPASTTNATPNPPAIDWKAIKKAIQAVRSDIIASEESTVSAAKAKELLIEKLNGANASTLDVVKSKLLIGDALPSLANLDPDTVRQADVANAALSTLRASRLQQILDPSVNAPEGKTLADAPSIARIDMAIEQIHGSKSEAIPLRPAGAILRTTYPITGVQSNGSRTTGNMLSSFVLDTLPIVGQTIRDIGNNIADPDRNPRLELALDQAFWQPINFIKVQGSGKTNYIVVKDDVGNWYVKNYSADPAVAYKSLEKLLATYYVPGKRLAGADILSKQASAGAKPQKPSSSLVEELEGQDRDDFSKHSEKVKSLGRALRSLADNANKPLKDAYSKSFDQWDKTTDQKLTDRARQALKLAKDFCLGWYVAAQKAYDDAHTKQSIACEVEQAAQKNYESALNSLRDKDPYKAFFAAKADLLLKDKEAKDAADLADKAKAAYDSAIKASADAKEQGDEVLVSSTEKIEAEKKDTLSQARQDLKIKEANKESAKHLFVSEKLKINDQFPHIARLEEEESKAGKDLKKLTDDLKTTSAHLENARAGLKTLSTHAKDYFSDRLASLQKREDSLKNRLLATIPSSH